MAKLRNNLKPLLMKHYNVEEERKLPSQAKIGEDFGVSQTTVSRWLAEKIDRFDTDVLEKFCKKLRVNVGDLLYMEYEEGELTA